MKITIDRITQKLVTELICSVPIVSSIPTSYISMYAKQLMPRADDDPDLDSTPHSTYWFDKHLSLCKKKKTKIIPYNEVTFTFYSQNAFDINSFEFHLERNTDWKDLYKSFNNWIKCVNPHKIICRTGDSGFEDFAVHWLELFLANDYQFGSGRIILNKYTDNLPGIAPKINYFDKIDFDFSTKEAILNISEQEDGFSSEKIKKFENWFRDLTRYRETDE